VWRVAGGIPIPRHLAIGYSEMRYLRIALSNEGIIQLLENGEGFLSSLEFREERGRSRAHTYREKRKKKD